MNKPIKAKNLPLFPIIDLDQLRRENRLEGTEVTDFFTARDGKVYLLMEQPSETQGKDLLSTPSTYTAVEIQLLPPIPQWKSSWIGRNSGCWKRRCFLLAS